MGSRILSFWYHIVILDNRGSELMRTLIDNGVSCDILSQRFLKDGIIQNELKTRQRSLVSLARHDALIIQMVILSMRTGGHPKMTIKMINFLIMKLFWFITELLRDYTKSTLEQGCLPNTKS